jgi:hypothetical protein
MTARNAKLHYARSDVAIRDGEPVPRSGDQ